MSHKTLISQKKARRFAIDAHESINQKRKYTHEPYHVHCARVVKLLREVTNDEEVLAAAWMHDVLEDVAPHKVNYSEEKIRQLFGDRVCDMVVELTDVKLAEGNRAARKVRDRMRLTAASVEVKTIKLADLIDNFIDICHNDPGFAKVIAGETEQLLPCLSGGHPALYLRLSELLTEYKASHKK